MTRTPLVHNPHNPITAGVWKVSGDPPYLLKILSPHQRPTHPDWTASPDPRAWNHWRREADLLTDGLHQAFADEGLPGAPILSREDRPDGTIALRVAWIDGRTGADLGFDDLVEVAHRLGRAQGRQALYPVDRPWLSRRFLRDHIASKQIDPSWLHREDAWAHPLVRDHWSPSLRDDLATFWAHRSRLIALAEQAPRTLGHLDLWSANLIARGDRYVLIDWACAGDAALGEDVSNLAFEAILDGLLPPDTMTPLLHATLDAYLSGLRTAGWTGDLGAVRRAHHACAVKWCWLGALHLQRAIEGGHHAYGGAVEPDPGAQYHARGVALAAAVTQAMSAMEHR